MPTSVWVWSPKTRRTSRKSGEQPKENAEEEKEKTKDMFDHLFDSAKKEGNKCVAPRRALSAHSNTRRGNVVKRDLSAPRVPNDTIDVPNDETSTQIHHHNADNKRCNVSNWSESTQKMKGKSQKTEKKATNGTNLKEATIGDNLKQTKKCTNLQQEANGVSLKQATNGATLAQTINGANLKQVTNGANLKQATNGTNLKQATNGCNIKGHSEEEKTGQTRNSNLFYENLTKSVRDYCISKNIERDDTLDGIPRAGDRVSRWVQSLEIVPSEQSEESGEKLRHDQQTPPCAQKLMYNSDKLPTERSNSDAKEARKSFPVFNFGKKNTDTPSSSRKHDSISKTNGKSGQKSQTSTSTPKSNSKSANAKNGADQSNHISSPTFVSRKKVVDSGSSSVSPNPARHQTQSPPSSPIILNGSAVNHCLLTGSQSTSPSPTKSPQNSPQPLRQPNTLLDSAITIPEDYQKYLLSIACPRNRALPGRTEICSPSDRLKIGLDCDEVFPGVIISTGATARNLGFLRSLGVSHIINTASRDVWLPQDKLSNLAIQYTEFHVDDVSSANITPFFEPSAQFMNEALAQGGTVLVNCLVGLSRSSTTVAASIMINQHWSLRRILHHMRQRRPIKPNSGFLRQLIQLEAKLKEKGICLC